MTGGPKSTAQGVTGPRAHHSSLRPPRCSEVLRDIPDISQPSGGSGWTPPCRRPETGEPPCHPLNSLSPHPAATQGHCHVPMSPVGHQPLQAGWQERGRASKGTRIAAERSSYLVIPVNEDRDHLGIHPLSREQGPQHPADRRETGGAETSWELMQGRVPRQGWEGCLHFTGQKCPPKTPIAFNLSPSGMAGEPPSRGSTHQGRGGHDPGGNAGGKHEMALTRGQDSGGLHPHPRGSSQTQPGSPWH